ncbi:MAG: tRNA pseudouridine(55) synthase TruB, partial [Candidatus Saccharimonas sp.]|nr:tRNA pseudouridine(55) synthase TruB [Planctomycetaceae bacterium]
MSWCGLLNVDKPMGMTSRQVVDHVQKLVRPDKAGHAGTLDPLATGVLIVCVGTATRLITRIQQGRKRYVGRFLLGKHSDTDDTDGEVIDGGDWSGVTRQSLEQTLPGFLGSIQQTPPRISAVKVAGHRAYKLARRGEVVELQPRPVEVFSLQISRFEPPEFELEIECGSGTYVRSIGRDMGERLGCGAVMSALRRTAIGRFAVADAVPLGSLNATSLLDVLMAPQAAVAELPRRGLDSAEVVRVRQGRPIPWGFIPDADCHGEVTLVDSANTMIGIALADPVQQQL